MSDFSAYNRADGHSTQYAIVISDEEDAEIRGVAQSSALAEAQEAVAAGQIPPAEMQAYAEQLAAAKYDEMMTARGLELSTLQGQAYLRGAEAPALPPCNEVLLAETTEISEANLYLLEPAFMTVHTIMSIMLARVLRQVLQKEGKLRETLIEQIAASGQLAAEMVLEAAKKRAMKHVTQAVMSFVTAAICLFFLGMVGARSTRVKFKKWKQGRNNKKIAANKTKIDNMRNKSSATTKKQVEAEAGKIQKLEAKNTRMEAQNAATQRNIDMLQNIQAYMQKVMMQKEAFKGVADGFGEMVQASWEIELGAAEHEKAMAEMNKQILETALASSSKAADAAHQALNAIHQERKEVEQQGHAFTLSQKA